MRSGSRQLLGAASAVSVVAAAIAGMVLVGIMHVVGPLMPESGDAPTFTTVVEGIDMALSHWEFWSWFILPLAVYMFISTMTTFGILSWWRRYHPLEEATER